MLCYVSISLDSFVLKYTNLVYICHESKDELYVTCTILISVDNTCCSAVRVYYIISLHAR